MRLLLTAVLLAAASTSTAQPASPRLFISPAGEPFRGGEGLERWFAGADADRDGRMTPDEFLADALRFFQTLDANKDGRVDGFETAAYERELVPEITGIYATGGDGDGPQPGAVRMARPGRGVGPGGGRQGAGRFGLLNIPQPITGADRDVDSRVTLDEWKKTLTIRFGMLDTTKAGVLTRETLPGGARPDEKKPRRRPPPRGWAPSA